MWGEIVPWSFSGEEARDGWMDGGICGGKLYTGFSLERKQGMDGWMERYVGGNCTLVFLWEEARDGWMDGEICGGKLYTGFSLGGSKGWMDGEICGGKLYTGLSKRAAAVIRYWYGKFHRWSLASQ